MTVKLIEGSDQVRAQKCLAEITNICAAYDCQMVPMLMLGPAGVIAAKVEIQAKPRAIMPEGPAVNGDPNGG